MTHLHRRRRGAIVAGALLASAALAVPAQASFPGTNGPIAYESAPGDSIFNPDGPASIWTVTADGKDPKLVAAPTDDWDGDVADPAWAPDARHLAYLRTASSSERQRIFVLDTATRAEHELQADGEEWQRGPAWSPTGDQLVYETGVLDGEESSRHALQIASVDGTIVRSLFIENAANPQWSPDGKWIAYDANGSIWATAADGSGEPVQLTGGEVFQGGDGSPNWAPDGKAITFQRSSLFLFAAAASPLPGWQIPWLDAKVVRVEFNDGNAGDEADVTDSDLVGSGFAPVWAPDGSRILLTRLALVGADATDETPPTEGPSGDFPWVPQGKTAVSTISSVLPNGDGLEDTVAGDQRYVDFADWAPAPTAQEPPAPQQPVTQPAPPAAKPAQGGVLPAFERKCVSRRNFTIRLRPRGKTIVRAKVVVAGKVAKVRRGNRWTAHVDLRTLPKNRFTVRVTVWTKDGKRFVEARRYWTCTPAKAVVKKQRG